MAKWTTTCGEARQVVLTEGTTFFVPPMGALGGAFPTESRIEARVRAAYHLADLYVRVAANNVDNPSTFRSRRNQANGNQSVSVPANTTGVFQDTVNSDFYVSGDNIASQMAIGAGAGGDSLNPNAVSYTIEDTAPTPLHMIGANFQWLMPRNLNEFSPMHGRLDGGTTDNTSYRFRVPSTIDQLRTFASFNTITSATTLRTRKNGANGNLSLSIPASTTGEVEDTVNSDGLVSGDNMNFNMVTGASMVANQIELDTVQVRVDSIARHLACGNFSNEDVPFSNTRAMQMEESLLGQAFGVQGRSLARTPYDAQNLFTNLVTNTLDDVLTATLRIGGTDSALGVSIPAGTTGEFEDTVDIISVVPTDEVSYITTSPGSTVGIYNFNQIGSEQRQPGAGDPALPEGLQATQPIMVMRQSRG